MAWEYTLERLGGEHMVGVGAAFRERNAGVVYPGTSSPQSKRLEESLDEEELLAPIGLRTDEPDGQIGVEAFLLINLVCRDWRSRS